MAKLTKDEYIQLIRQDSIMNIDEIAKELQITEPQVKHALRSGITKLRLICMAKKLHYKDCFD